MAFENGEPMNKLSDEMRGYIEYIYSFLKKSEIVLKDNVSSSDPFYKQYAEGEIALSELLKHGINNSITIL